MALTLSLIKQHMIPHEGSVPYMYLDKVGKVTVGIGNMLPSARAAQTLAFVHRSSRQPASPAEIKRDFEAVAEQLKGLPHRKYRPHTKLELPLEQVDALFERRIEQFTLQLIKYFPEYPAFPDSAQLALLDMAFNLGAHALHTKWPNLKRAVHTRDWLAAELECNRATCSARRNAATKALFRAAAQSSATPTQRRRARALEPVA